VNFTETLYSLKYYNDGIVAAPNRRTWVSLFDTDMRLDPAASHKCGVRFTKYFTAMLDYFTIMPKLRSTYDRRLINQTFYEERKAFLTYDLLAKS